MRGCRIFTKDDALLNVIGCTSTLDRSKDVSPLLSGVSGETNIGVLLMDDSLDCCLEYWSLEL
jgi:hypothetical protein